MRIVTDVVTTRKNERNKTMQNEVIKAIMERRSIRAFKPEQISDAEINTILQAGIFAPSAMNQQNWHFTVVQNQELLNEINDKAKHYGTGTGNDYIEKLMTNPHLHIFYNAPTVIVVSEENDSYAATVNTSAAIENILLAAHSLGIGSCWIGLSRYAYNSEMKEYFIEKLGLPENFTPTYSVALGYPKGNSPESKPRKESTINFIR